MGVAGYEVKELLAKEVEGMEQWLQGHQLGGDCCDITPSCSEASMHIRRQLASFRPGLIRIYIKVTAIRTENPAAIPLGSVENLLAAF